MSKIERVIKGLEHCINEEDCAGCVYYNDYRNKMKERHSENKCPCFLDVIALLKEQEAVEPHYTTLRYFCNGKEAVVQHPECPRCIKNGLTLWDAEIEKGQAYCKRCGQKVKWNE